MMEELGFLICATWSLERCLLAGSIITIKIIIVDFSAGKRTAAPSLCTEVEQVILDLPDVMRCMGLDALVPR